MTMRHVIVNTTHTDSKPSMPEPVVESIYDYAVASCEAFGYDSYTIVCPAQAGPELLPTGREWSRLSVGRSFHVDVGGARFSEHLSMLIRAIGAKDGDTLVLASPRKDIIAARDHGILLKAHEADRNSVAAGVRRINGNHHPSMLINIQNHDRVKDGYCFKGKRSGAAWREYIDGDQLDSFPDEREVKGSQYLPPLYRLSSHLVACTVGSPVSRAERSVKKVPLTTSIPKDFPLLALPYYVMASNNI